MSWHRIVLPFNTEIDPDMVKIGKLAWAAYEKEDKPLGFAIFHATEKNEDGNENWIVYLSPLAASLSSEVAENYKVEPCEVPARDEPNMAFVFGDPLVMGHLQDSYEAKLASAAANSAS